MSKRIPQSFVDELVTRADIVDVVGSRVALKRAGREFKGLCPFHDEKTPSFTVSPAKGFYHCFGCGAHGTALGFLMSYDNLGFREAAEALAEMLGLEMPKESGADPEPAETGLLPLLREAEQLYRGALRESPAATEYLKRRGIDDATIARFGVGYAPDSWNTLLRELGHAEPQREKLIEAGLVIRNEQGRCYDRFRDRIMFPIRDTRGDVIGFGGRVLGAGEPKYMNSPETPLFHKGRALYGLYEARRRQGRPEQVVVVEGYLDVASLVQFGIEPVVATLGTATTIDHVRMLTRMADRIVFCFDGDRAGRAAAWRALETALPVAGGNVEIRFLLLPAGEDPDSLVRARGADAFRDLLAGAIPLSEFLVGELAGRVDPSHADGRGKLVALARPLLDRLPRGIYRELLIDELARRIDMAPARLGELLETAPAASGGRPAGPAATRGLPAGPAAPPRGLGGLEPPRAHRADEGKSTRIRSAIRLILHYPGAARAAEPVAGLDRVDLPGAELLRQLLEIVRDNPNVSRTAHLLERFRGQPAEPHLERLAATTPLDEESAAPAVLRDNLALIVQDYERRHRGDTVRKSGRSLN